MNHVWRTPDMSLAAFLSLMLDEDPDLEWEMDSCFYVFDKSEDLLDLVQQYIGDDALVNPRQYNTTFAKLKKSTFEHPDAPLRHARRRVSAG